MNKIDNIIISISIIIGVIIIVLILYLFYKRNKTTLFQQQPISPQIQQPILHDVQPTPDLIKMYDDYVKITVLIIDNPSSDSDIYTEFVFNNENIISIRINTLGFKISFNYIVRKVNSNTIYSKYISNFFFNFTEVSKQIYESDFYLDKILTIINNSNNNTKIYNKSDIHKIYQYTNKNEEMCYVIDTKKSFIIFCHYQVY